MQENINSIFILFQNAFFLPLIIQVNIAAKMLVRKKLLTTNFKH